MGLGLALGFGFGFGFGFGLVRDLVVRPAQRGRIATR